LELKIKEIKMILEQISEALLQLNAENFDPVLTELNQNLSKITAIKQDLKSQFDLPTLKSHEEPLNILTKQIYERFDNIINEMKREQTLIQIELKNIQNKKKLANYNR
jgi:hypothetical protein